ncbi:MAG TPA: helix-turn-helix domain-containing protein [Solirubrobacterales bacterium]
MATKTAKKSNRTQGEDAEAGRSGAIGRGFEILRALRASRAPLSLTAVAEAIGVAPSSAHSILTQLLAQDAVRQDEDKRYQLGPVTFYVGAAFSRGSAPYRSTWVELVDLANEFSVIGALAVPWESHHLILQSHRAGSSDVDVPFGGRVPIDAGAWGKVYYAFSGAEQPAKLSAYTQHSVVDVRQYAEQLEQVRENGYAVDDSEVAEGIGGVSAPITGNTGYEGLAALIGSTGTLEEIDQAILGRRLAAVAARASLTLGDSSRMRLFGNP